MIIEDEEFGEVLVRRNARARAVKFSVSTSGRLSMSVPQRTPNFMLKRYLAASREQIKRELPIKDPRLQKTRELHVARDDFAEYWANEGAGGAERLCDYSRAGAFKSCGSFGGVLGGSGGARLEV